MHQSLGLAVAGVGADDVHYPLRFWICRVHSQPKACLVWHARGSSLALQCTHYQRRRLAIYVIYSGPLVAKWGSARLEMSEGARRRDGEMDTVATEAPLGPSACYGRWH